MSPVWIWQTLGIAPTPDRREIRRAYAGRLKTTNPEDDSEGFKALRAAYEQAMVLAERRVVPVAAEIAPPPREPAAPAAEIPESTVQFRGRSPDEKVRHAAACDRLAALVIGPSPADPAVLDQALDAVLSSPALDDVGIRVETDRWLVQLIARHPSRSDPLLDKAIDRFGWSARAIDRKDAAFIRWLLQRHEDLGFLRRLTAPEHMYRRAFDALRRPPPGRAVLDRLLRRDLGDEVQALIYDIRANHPTLIGDLDEAALAAWDRSLSRPKLPYRGLWFVVSAPISLGLLLAARFVSWHSPDHELLATIVLLVVPCLAAVILIHIFGVSWPRWYWRQHPTWQRVAWLRLGWAPGALLLLIVAAVVPPILTLTVVIVALAAAIGFWVLITGRADRPDPGLAPPGRLALGELALVAWWILLRPGFAVGAYVQMSAALAAALAASIFGVMPLLDLWYGRLQARDRTLGLLALFLPVMAAGALLWLAPRDPILASLAAATVAAVALLSRIPLTGMGPRTARLYQYFMRISGGIVAVVLINDGAAVLPVGGAWLLAAAAVGGCGVLASQPREPAAG